MGMETKMKEIFKLNIAVDEWNEVCGNKATARMILFHGDVESPYFTGKICNGGVDTQYQPKGGANHLSARYIMEGIDDVGNPCKIFVENNGTDMGEGKLVTKPVILTNSERLKWLEEEELSGKVCHEDGKLVIRIYQTSDMQD